MKNKSDISLLNILTRFMANTLSVVFRGGGRHNVFHLHISRIPVFSCTRLSTYFWLHSVFIVYMSVCVCVRENFSGAN